MQIFNVLVALPNILAPHISKAHPPIVLMYVNLNWIDTLKISQEKRELSPTREVKAQIFMEVFVFRMRFNLNNIFASDAWAEMSWNEPKWAQKILNEPKSV